jgi:hypothetical protein
MSSTRVQSALARRLPVKLTLRSKRLATGAEAPGHEAVEGVLILPFVIGRDLSDTGSGDIRFKMNWHGTTMYVIAVGGAIPASLGTI